MQNDESRRLSLFYLTALALALGLVTGLGAFLFRDLIGLLHNLFFTGRFALPYDANEFTASEPMGSFCHPGAGNRRGDRHLPGQQFCA